MKTQDIEIQKLIKARARMEQKLREFDLKIDHVLFRMDEEKRCFARKCPFEDGRDLSDAVSSDTASFKDDARSGDNAEE